MNKVLFSLVLLTLAGCSTLPDNLKLADEQNLVNYQQVAAEPAVVTNKAARWGGVIARVENQPDTTMLEVVHYPLRSYGRPVPSDQSVGRFRVYVDGFLDPMVYEKGRSMTFAGQVLGVENGLVGEHEYVFPTLHANGYYLWKEIQQVDVHAIDLWPYFYWRGHHYSPYYTRHIYIRGNSNSKVVRGNKPQGAVRIQPPKRNGKTP